MRNVELQLIFGAHPEPIGTIYSACLVKLLNLAELVSTDSPIAA
jgi:hypothetical protein